MNKWEYHWMLQWDVSYYCGMLMEYDCNGILLNTLQYMGCRIIDHLQFRGLFFLASVQWSL